ncbi:MAG: HAMP domain-containing histidine kinase [Oscillospiraceae bacterium]|nr:HAMP domain-containing histidine kinase [Oscillospiraceae bacterium]
MEKTVKRALRLRADFIKYVTVTFLFVAVLSIVVILGCHATREWLVPSSDKVYLNWTRTGEYENVKDVKPYGGFVRLSLSEPSEINPFYSDDPNEPRTATLGAALIYDGAELQGIDLCVTRDYNSPESLPFGQKFMYYASGTAMIIVPVLLSLTGVLLCGFLFYEEKLKMPIEELFSATEKIAAQDLDFTVSYRSCDELGALCESFEQMRTALLENNERMWHMLAERRRLQASVAHDLRNPIAIIKAHAEYLKINAEKNKLSSEKTLSISDNITGAAARLEHYTESIRALNRLEELEVEREETVFSELFKSIRADFAAVAVSTDRPNGVDIHFENHVGEQTLNIDKQALCRIIENLIGNALRFAASEIRVDFSYENGILTALISNDGSGFSDKVLRAGDRFFVTDKSDSTHSGLGLAICRILARKHGGGLDIGNKSDGGAFVKIFLKA